MTPKWGKDVLLRFNVQKKIKIAKQEIIVGDWFLTIKDYKNDFLAD